MSLYRPIVNPFTGDLQLVPSATIINFEAAVANEAALPLVGNNPNDARITNDTGHLWVWDDDTDTWVDQGDIIDLDWSAITNGPSSSPTDIDDAVTKRHTQNTDTKLDEGQPTEVTSAELRTALDTTIPAKADKVAPFEPHTLFLSHFEGADESQDFVDEEGHTFSVVGNPHLDTADKYFGNSSLRLDNGTTLKIDDSPDWDFGTSEFTIECFAKFESHVGEYRVILARGVYYDQPSLNWGYQPTNNRIDFQISTNLGTHLYGFGFAPTDGVWYHLAIVRTNGVSGTIKMYVNGIPQSVSQQTGGEIANGSVLNTNKPLEIGGVADFPAQNFVGWIDEMRISNSARYTASFSIPTHAFYPECDDNVALVQGADGNLEDSSICHELLEQAIDDRHLQNTDQYVDFGGPNETTAEEIRSHIDDTNNPHATTADQIDTDETGLTVQDKIDEFNTHEADTNNPHNTTAEQVETTETGTSVQDFIDNLSADQVATSETGSTVQDKLDEFEASIATKTSAYRNSFVDADLSGGILTVTHGLGQKYVQVQVYDENDKMILPDEITLTNTTTLTIDLSSFGTISGTWHYIVIG